MDLAAPQFDDQTRTELEAAAFRRLVEHLRERTDVQNIDLMNLAGFCRNCLSRWYREAAEARDVILSDPEAREKAPNDVANFLKPIFALAHERDFR